MVYQKKKKKNKVQVISSLVPDSVTDSIPFLIISNLYFYSRKILDGAANLNRLIHSDEGLQSETLVPILFTTV